MKNEKNIADQFQGMEIEFNDKATLFPVQVEKQTTRQRQSFARSITRKRANVYPIRG